MSRSLYILVILMLVMASCQKPAREKKTYFNSGLVGKWQYTEHYMSIGGPGQWSPVQPPGQKVEFKADGSFESAEGFSSVFTQYQIIDSATVKFIPAPVSSGFVVMKYEFDVGGKTLLLYPIEPMCVEGCAYKFLRVPL